jgi:hypothetical protein
MKIEELYKRYINAYEIEVRECSTTHGKNLLKEINLLENLTIEEFEERLKDKTFNDKWGDKPDSSSNFMYNWIRSKSGR